MTDQPVPATFFAIPEGYNEVDIRFRSIFRLDTATATSLGAVWFVEGQKVLATLGQACNHAFGIIVFRGIYAVNHRHEL
jgi:hypothetical protein